MSEEEYERLKKIKLKYEKAFLQEDEIEFLFYVIEKQEDLIASLFWRIKYE